jgi:HPt (histidine-containing phosphotransfer) domain-containing protein
MIGADTLARLLPDTVENIRTSVAELTVAAEAGDIRQVKRIAHRIKGVCAQYGMLGAGEDARLIEVDLDQTDDIRARVAGLETSFSAAAAELAAYIASLREITAPAQG